MVTKTVVAIKFPLKNTICKEWDFSEIWKFNSLHISLQNKNENNQTSNSQEEEAKSDFIQEISSVHIFLMKNFKRKS